MTRKTYANITKLALAGVTAIGLSAGTMALAQQSGAQGSGPHMNQGQGGPGKHMQKSEKKRGHTSRQASRFIRLYDLNDDGKVTPDEIAKDQALVFGAMDVDGDKTLSVEEMKRRGRTLEVFRAATIFDMLDINGDGKLSLSEVQGPSKRWFKRYDENGDGAMEADEVPGRGYHRGRKGSRRGR